MPDAKFVFSQKGDDEKAAKHRNVVRNWVDELESHVPVPWCESTQTCPSRPD